MNHDHHATETAEHKDGHNDHAMPDSALATRDGHDEHQGHGARQADHTGHEMMFRNRFWDSLLLNIPMYRPLLQARFGFAMPVFPGRRNWRDQS